MKKKPKKPPPPPPTSQIETFRDVRGYDLDRMVTEEPYCFNGWVGVRKYRVTVEEIEEPIEVLQARLLKLWRECNNHHNWRPLQAAASRLGMTLDFADAGKDAKKR